MSDNLESIEKFKQPSNLRTFCIVTKTDNLYVNLQYLAEISEYFNCICTKQFIEKNNNKVILDDLDADMLAEFLAFVCPDEFCLEKTLTQNNICNVLYFSDRLMFHQIKKDIKRWLKTDNFKNMSISPITLIDAIIIFEQQSYKLSDIESVYKKLALVDEVQLGKSFESIDKLSRLQIMDKIRIYRPYEFKRRPESFFDWEDYRARIFF